MKSRISSLNIAVGLLAVAVLGCNAGRRADSVKDPSLTGEHYDAIQKALKAKGFPPPTLTMGDSGFLVATFELQAPPRQPLRTYAEEAILTIRNTMLPFHVVDKYRVTLNGPSPGPGLIRRYGTARFIEGGSVSWEPAE